MIWTTSSLNSKKSVPKTQNQKAKSKKQNTNLVRSLLIDKTPRVLPFAFCLLPFAFLYAVAPDYPVLIEKLPNPNDYSLFANSGWDGNWYVGYNTCWIKQLPPVPMGTYQRAFIGAKLGRMKVESYQKIPSHDKRPIAGELYMALSSTMAWTPNEQHLLTRTENIPLEGDAEDAIEGTGEAQWFWTEVPVQSLNKKGGNFLALWSATSGMVSVSSSPVLAAGWGGKEVDTWLLHDVHGGPPKGPVATGATGVSFFQPAIALKLIPAGPPHALRAKLISWQNGTVEHPKPILTASVEGDSVERAWVEYLGKDQAWVKVGRILWHAPYIFSLDYMTLPMGKLKLHAVAANIWEETASSDPVSIEVSPVQKKSE